MNACNCCGAPVADVAAFEESDGLCAECNADRLTPEMVADPKFKDEFARDAIALHGELCIDALAMGATTAAETHSRLAFNVAKHVIPAEANPDV